MCWWLGFALLLLALGTLRVVGCGDEGGPECIYPSGAVGSVRDPACDDENECTEGRCYEGVCSNESWFRNGAPCDSADVPDVCSTAICLYGSCEITEKPCEGDLHEDCLSALRSYSCDPNTGVVECTWWDHGTNCCLEEEYYCPDGILTCGWYCRRRGECSDGACVGGS